MAMWHPWTTKLVIGALVLAAGRVGRALSQDKPPAAAARPRSAPIESKEG